MKSKSINAIKKILETLSIEELDTVIKMANDIKIIKEPFYRIRYNFILLNIKTNDISQFGNSFRADKFTYEVICTWQIDLKIYELESTAKAWMSYGDCSIESPKIKWNTGKPNLVYCKIAEYVAEEISKSFREDFDNEKLNNLLNNDKNLIEMLKELDTDNDDKE